ncbi:sensor histidine kinase [Spirosoma aerophilum]
MYRDYKKTADEIILDQYTPAGVIVNEALDIVHFRGLTTPYLEEVPGQLNQNMLRMAKHGLVVELSSLLHDAKKKEAAVRKENIPFQVNDFLWTIAIDVIPLPSSIVPYYLILFHNQKANELPPDAAHLEEANLPLTYQLKQELAQAREDIRRLMLGQKTVNEEGQRENRELLISNGELQRLNHELEISKDEQKNANDALTIVNREMITLNEQVTATRDYAEAIIGNMREPLLVLDATLRIQTANNAFYKTFQVNERETENVLVYDIGNKQWDIPELRTLLERILPEKSTFRDFEITHTFSTIGKRVMLLNAREIVNKNSLEKLILLSIEDTTVETKARDLERLIQKQLQFIADAMPEKVWTADAMGNANYFNQSWLTYTGFAFEALKGSGWKKVIHPDDWEENQKRWQYSIRTGADFEMQHRFLTTEGTYKWHFSRSIAQKDEQGAITMWIGTDTEIHEQKTQHEVLEKAVVNRTRELKEANETLEGKNKELAYMNKELESFTYISSHDLQEPLRKIQTFAGRILDQENQQLTDKSQNYLLRLQQAAARMQQLIQDLLAFSRVNTGERKFEPTDLNVLIDEVVDELQETIQEKHATLIINKLDTLNIIVFQFRQLIQNLLVNALKFSTPARPPVITISSYIIKGDKAINARLLTGKNYCHITVADNGIGFDPQYSERIFDVFQRLHSKEQYNGTGIGLAIAKKIVENHNGLITATGKLTEGACFDMYIPVS